MNKFTKCVLMSVLLIAIGTSAVYAQRVGDSVQLGGQPYIVESVSGDRVVLQRATINGVWAANGWRVTINGSTGVINAFGTFNAAGQDAFNKGYWKVGDQYFRNIRSTGNLTWSGQFMAVAYNTRSPDVATGTQYGNVIFTMSADGKTLTQNDGTVWTRQ